MIGNKLIALKVAMEGSYRWVMLALMVVETILVATLVLLEALRR